MRNSQRFYSVLIVVNMRGDGPAGAAPTTVAQYERLGISRAKREPPSPLTHHYAYETAMKPIVFNSHRQFSLERKKRR